MQPIVRAIATRPRDTPRSSSSEPTRNNVQSLAVLAMYLFSGMASASLVFDTDIFLSAQGFGTAPRDLTIQNSGMQATTESGCVGVDSSGNIIFGAAACTAEASVHDFNGFTNTGGNEPSPNADNQKYGIPTLGSLGITTASELGILFNGTESAGNGAFVRDITLNFFSGTGTHALLGAIDGSFDFLNTVAGNGSAGFVFRVSDDELAYVNDLIASGVMLSLNGSLSNINGGPDTFRIVNLGSEDCTGNCTPQQIPEPGSLALLGLGALGFLTTRRKQWTS